MTLEDLLKAKREEILRVCAKYGARNVRVFGSVARSEADERSDIDFLVEMEPGRSLFDLGGLQQELEQLLGCRVDVVTERGLKGRVRDQVLSEAVPLWESPRNGCATSSRPSPPLSATSTAEGADFEEAELLQLRFLRYAPIIGEVAPAFPDRLRSHLEE
jgi:predicted nucleotidyltransferase